MANNNLANMLYTKLQSTGKYPVILLHGSEICADLYVSCSTAAAVPSPLNISMTCDTNNNTLCATVTNAPRLSASKIRTVIHDQCPWLTLHMYICHYQSLWGCPYLVITVALDADICDHFADYVVSMDHMLRTLFNLPKGT